MPGGLIPRDPQAETRTRRALGQIGDILNSLIESGDIILTGPGTWVLNPALKDRAATSVVFEEYASETLLVPGERGRDGQAGRDGLTFLPEEPVQGEPGFPGQDGKAGAPGRDGLTFLPEDASDGEPGMPGRDGRDGQAGRDGLTFLLEEPPVEALIVQGERGLQGFPGRDGLAFLPEEPVYPDPDFSLGEAAGVASNIITPSKFSAKGWSVVAVSLGTNQSLTQSAFNTIHFDTETSDTEGEFDTTAYTFTPKSSGMYLVTFGATLGSSSGRAIALIRTTAPADVGLVADGTLIFCGGTVQVNFVTATAYIFTIFPTASGVTATAGAATTYLFIRRLAP